MKKRTLNRRFSQATGLVSVGMLTMTACVGIDDQEAPEEEQDDVDQDEAEDDTDAAGQDADQDAEEDALAEAPALEDIEDDVWESSLDQESVSLRIAQDQMVGGSEELEDIDDIDDTDDDDTEPLNGVSPQLDDDDDDEDDDPLQDEEDIEDSAEDDGEIELRYSGEMTGEGSAMDFTLGDVDGMEFQGEYLTFGETIYQSTEGFITDLLVGAPEDVEVPDPDDIEDAFELNWVDHSDFQTTLNHTAEQYLEEIRDNLDLLLGEDELADLDAEASEGTHEGEDVWIYETDEVEIIVLADEEEPLLLHVDVDYDGIESSIEFSEWNESEEPEEPDSDDVYSAEEAMEIVEEL